MISHHTDFPVSEEALAFIIEKFDEFLGEVADEVQTNNRLVLQALLPVLQARASAEGKVAKADPSEDPLEREIRRTAAVAQAKHNLIGQLDRRSSSPEEFNYLLSTLIGQLVLKLSMTHQAEMLKKDIESQVSKL